MPWHWSRHTIVYRLLDGHGKRNGWLCIGDSSSPAITEAFESESMVFKLTQNKIDFEEKVYIDKERTVFLSNFFPNSSLDELRFLFSGYQLKNSAILNDLSFSKSGKYLIARFADSANALSAHRNLDGMLIRDKSSGRLIRKLCATLN